jgi:hypothetical protein
MNIDVVLKPDVVLEQVRRKLTEIPFCYGGEILQGLMLDHVEVGKPELLPRAAADVHVRLEDGSERLVPGGHHLRLQVNLTVFVVNKSDVKKAGVHSSKELIPLHLEIVYEVFAEPIVNHDGEVRGAQLRFTFVSKSATLPDAKLDAILDKGLRSGIPPVPLAFDALANALEVDRVRIQNVGLAVSANLHRIALRVEIEKPSTHTVTDWKNFFSSPPDLLNGRDFGVRVDRRLVQDAAEHRFDAELAKHISELRPIERASSTWNPSAPGLTLFAFVAVINKCPTGVEIGVHVMAKVTLTIRQASGVPQLELLSNITWNAVDSDLLLCGLSTGGLIGAAIGTMVGGLIGLVIGGAIGTVVAAVAAGIVADLRTPDVGDQPDCDTVAADDDHIVKRCRRPFVLEEPLIGTIAPDELAADEDGLILRGSITSPPHRKPDLVVGITPLGWSTEGNCNTHTVEHERLGSFRFLDGTFTHPTRICGAEIDGDHLGFFHAEHASLFGGLDPSGIVITLHDKHAAEYFAAPYDCKLYVWSTLGARYLNLGKLPPEPPPPDPDELRKAILESCLRGYSGFWHEKLSLDWLVDPPIDGRVLHRWDFAVTGLFPGNALSVLNEAKTSIALAPANANGAARLSIVVPPSGRLAIRRVAAAGSPAVTEFTPSRHRLSITQTLLVERRRLALAGRCLDLASFRGVGRRQLVAITESGLQVWDQDVLRGLVLRTQLRDPGLRGGIPMRGGVLLYGKSGLHHFAALEDGRLAAAAPVHRVEIEQLEVGSGGLVARHGEQQVSLPPELVALAKTRGNDPRLRIGVDATRASSQTWLDDTVPVGPWLAHLEGDRRTITVYRAEKSVPVRSRVSTREGAKADPRRRGSLPVI